jgi:hypothetical protein
MNFTFLLRFMHKIYDFKYTKRQQEKLHKKFHQSSVRGTSAKKSILGEDTTTRQIIKIAKL